MEKKIFIHNEKFSIAYINRQEASKEFFWIQQLRSELSFDGVDCKFI